MTEGQSYYYAGDRRVPIELVDDAVAVAFNEPISERRLEQLRAEASGVTILGRSPALLSRNVLIYRPGTAARGADRIGAFAERVARGPSVRFSTLIFRDEARGLYLVLLDEIVARLKPEVSDEQARILFGQLRLEPVERKLYNRSQYVLRVVDPTPRRTLDAANRLHESDLVAWAEPNFLMEKELRLLAFQWHLNNTGQSPTGQGPGVVGEDARAVPAWAIGQGSGNVVIAVIDEGVEVAHPSLRGNIAEGGRNFDNPLDPSNPNPVGDGAHGTACAGVAAGDGGRTVGVARRSKILPIKALGALNNDLADAIHYAASRAPVLSNSWGAPNTVIVDAAISDVIASGREGKGTVVLFAVGNENQAIPAGDQSRVAGVIAVGASNNVGARSGYSNIGDAVDNPGAGLKRISVLAPSDGTSANRPFWQASLAPLNTAGVGPFEEDGSTENIFTTDITGPRGFNPIAPGVPSIPEPPPTAADPDHTGLFGGTSSACPLVAGVCALMLSQHAALTAAQVKYILEATADKIGTVDARAGVPRSRPRPGKAAAYDPATGHDPAYGFGRVNALKAVRAARGDALPQLVRPAGGAPALTDAIPVPMRRQGRTTRFVSEAVLVLVDARLDPDQLTAEGRIFVRGGPGGFLRATYRPTGAAQMSDEVEIQGAPA